MALLIAYREYTTDGRFVSAAEYETHSSVLADDLVCLFESNDKPTRLAVGEIYKHQKLMSKKEELKELFRTNVSVRDTKTGRFVKWGNLI
ncbi:hypothetical protein NDAWWUGD_CDS0075 [Salmonella phage SeKF_80]|uniref:Uncharacterized protein n=1 Tax=Salmonella phage 7-11 TaxID=1054968 RepID=G0X4Z8_9CAUD|nr:hypothetical protein SaPh711_gp065 [Salmonella phage 7-11]AEK81980.1 hypothetical protein [Salmonella phage 7-11]